MKEEPDEIGSAPLFRRHARRPRLTGLLDETKAQAILLTAPAGYGKTTLAHEWLQDRANVAWYRATTASADVAAFSTGLANVLAPILRGAGERLRQRVRVGEPPEKAARPLAELLAADLAPWPQDGMIVIDDYHLVADSAPVEEFVDWLLTLVPVRVLVTTRRRPAWASARRFLYGEVLEVGAEQLAMNDEEAGRVLTGRSSDAVRTLVRQAQGWPALIGLAALSASLELPEERVSDALFRYFAEEVLRREPPHVQRFMLLASVPTTVSETVAREVLGIEDSEPIVDRLREEDLLDLEPSGSHRFHPLLRDFLRRRLVADEQSLYAELSARAVTHARSASRWEEAFELAVELGDLRVAAEIVAAAAGDLLASGRIETLDKWLAQSTPPALELPAAVLAKAELLIHTGEVSRGIALAQPVANRLADDDPNASRAWNLTGRGLHLTSRDEEAFESYRRALAAAPDRRERSEALWGLFLSANEARPEESAGYLSELEALAGGDIDMRLRLAVGYQFVAEQEGTLAGLWDRYAALLPTVDHASNPLARTSFLANAAATQMGRGYYHQAWELAQRALTLCRELHLDFAVGACLAFRAGAEIGLRQFRQAERTLRDFQETSSIREDPYFQIMALSLRAKLSAATGRPEEALEARGLAPEEIRSRRGHGEFLATLSIIAAARGDADLTLHLSGRARSLAGSVEAVRSSNLARVILKAATVRDRSGCPELDQVIQEADAADFRDGLVLGYRVFPRMLQLASRPAAIRSLERALALSNDQNLARQAGLLRSTTEAGSRQILTPREREVLQLMRRGLSNAEIAETLFITPNTAKVHVHHILEKLGVRSRVQAILRAEELLEEND